MKRLWYRTVRITGYQRVRRAKSTVQDIKGLRRVKGYCTGSQRVRMVEGHCAKYQGTGRSKVVSKEESSSHS